MSRLVNQTRKRKAHFAEPYLQYDQYDQGGSGFLDSLKNLFGKVNKVVSKAQDIAFGPIGTAISNLAPDSDENARPLYPGEVHAFLKLPNGKMGRANYMG